MNTLGRLWYVLWPPLLIVVVLIALWQLAVVLLDIPGATFISLEGRLTTGGTV